MENEQKVRMKHEKDEDSLKEHEIALRWVDEVTEVEQRKRINDIF